MFHILFGAVSGACITFVPAYAGIRLALERTGNGLDLLYITTISPGRIIRGKLFAGIIITTILFSAALPFLSVTFLLRGIDLPSVTVVLVMTFLVVMFAVQCAVFLACIPSTRPFKALIALAATAGLVTLVIGINVAAAAMLEEGVGSMLRTRMFWEPTLITLSCGVTLFGLLHVFSVALVSPSTANRALPIRIYITLLWIIGGIVALYYCRRIKDASVIFAWTVPSIIILSAALLMAISERAQLSERVRRTIPRRILRPLAFLFYNGPAGGVIWVLTLAAITFAVSHAAGTTVHGVRMVNHDSFLATWRTVFLYICTYAMMGLLIWRMFLTRKCPESTKWVVALLFMAACSIIPTLVVCALARTQRDVSGIWFLGNVFALADPKYRFHHALLAGCWAFVATALNLPWMLRQVRTFRPPADGT